MYYNLRLVNKIQEWPFFIHLHKSKSNFVLNHSEPLVLINSAQIQITRSLCTSNGTHAIGCRFEHHHFPGDRRFCRCGKMISKFRLLSSSAGHVYHKFSLAGGLVVMVGN